MQRKAGNGYPLILLVIFLLSMTAIGIFLLTDESPRQASTESSIGYR